MQTLTVPRFQSELYQEALEEDARREVQKMFDRYGLSEWRQRGMHCLPRELSAIDEMARIMARNMIAQNSTEAICLGHGGEGRINTDRTLR